MPLVLTEFTDQIGWITLNHDAKRNALGFDLLSGLRHALTEHKKNLARVVVIRSNRGAKVWSAGFFVDELSRDGSDPLAYDHPLLEVIRQIQDFPAPVIVMAEGSIWGGACNIAFVADIVIGTKDTSMAITPAKLGVPYNTSGILQFLETLGGHVVREMFFTAEPITAQRAHGLGVINHLVPVEELEAFTTRLTKRIIGNSSLSIAVIKEQLNTLANATPVTATTFEHIDTLRRIVGHSLDYTEGLQAFTEKRTPQFRGV